MKQFHFNPATYAATNQINKSSTKLVASVRFHGKTADERVQNKSGICLTVLNIELFCITFRVTKLVNVMRCACKNFRGHSNCVYIHYRGEELGKRVPFMRFEFISSAFEGG